MGEELVGPALVAGGVFHMTGKQLRPRSDAEVDGFGYREAACECGTGTCDLSKRVAHRADAEPRHRLGGRPQRAGRERSLVPVQPLPGMSANHPEEKQVERDLGGFHHAAAFDQPAERGPIVLEIVSHPVQPFGLCVAHQPFRGCACLPRAVAREPRQGALALAVSGRLEEPQRREPSRASRREDVTCTELSARSSRLLSISVAAVRSTSSWVGAASTSPASTAAAASIENFPGRTPSRRNSRCSAGESN